MIWENDDYLAINNASFYIYTRGPSPMQITFCPLYKELCGEVFVCHRLDKETSGALLLAKNEDSYRHASLQFENREVEKIYHALVKGRFGRCHKSRYAVENYWLRQGAHRSSRAKSGDTFQNQKKAGPYTLLEAKPISGRRHQIRVHLAYLEFPICGDEQYGGEAIYLSQFKKNYRPPNDREERPLFDRVALHPIHLNSRI